MEERFVVLHGELIGDALWDRKISDEWTLDDVCKFLNNLDKTDSIDMSVLYEW